MKKLLALLMAFYMVLSMTACFNLDRDKEEEDSEPEKMVEIDSATIPSEEATQPTTPAVTAPAKKVNTAKLDAIELKDDFSVKIETVNFNLSYDPIRIQRIRNPKLVKGS